jgi:hypothetical protein
MPATTSTHRPVPRSAVRFAALVAVFLSAGLAQAPAAPAADDAKAAAAEEKAVLAATEKEMRRRHEEAVKQAVDDFKKGLREAKNIADRVALVKKLSETERDPKIQAEIARLLSDPAESVRIEAMQGLAGYRRDKAASNALVGALPLNSRTASMLSHALDAIGSVGHESAVPVVARHVADKEERVAAAAIRALGQMNSPAAVPLLIETWERLEKDKTKGDEQKKAAEERLKAVEGPLKEALAALTGQKQNAAADYRAWWSENRATLKPKEEPPPALCRHFVPIHVVGGHVTGSVFHEVWRNLPGNNLDDAYAALSRPPSSASPVTSFESPVEIGDDYATRIRGFLHPPVDGEYVFWISSDDGSALFLSPDESPERKVRIAWAPGDTRVKEWGKFSEQTSKPVALAAGRRYYIEAVHKEGGGGNDHVAVAWQPPGGAREVIPGKYLSLPHAAWGAATAGGGTAGAAPPPPAAVAFYRAVNLNGPALTIDGYPWEGKDAPNCSWSGTAFENQAVPLLPSTDEARARMIRASVYNGAGSNVTLSAVPPGTYRVYLYVWEDNASQTFSVSVNGTRVLSDHASGAAGRWEKLGPWTAAVTDGQIRIACTPGDANLSGLEVWRVLPPAIAGARHPAPVPGAGPAAATVGRIAREVWWGVQGGLVEMQAGNRFATAPDESVFLDRFEAPENVGDRYVARVRGFLVPAASGEHRFWIASDNESELWLSTDEDPAKKRRIAGVLGGGGANFTTPRGWTEKAGQSSEPVTLAAGRRYYIEAIHAEGEGGDHLAVAWQPPGTSGPEVIPGRCLAPFVQAVVAVAAAPAPALTRPGSAFIRGINLNGPAMTIDGHAWEAGNEAENCLVFGRPVRDDVTSLVPSDAAREPMLRTALAHGGGRLRIVLSGLPAGRCRVCLYTWGSAGSDRFDVRLNGAAVEGVSPGPAGAWQRRGPWPIAAAEGVIAVECTGGAEKVCGIEVWKE